MAPEPWTIISTNAGPSLTFEWLWERVSPASAAVADELALCGVDVRADVEHMRFDFSAVVEHLALVPTLEAVLNGEIEMITMLNAPDGYDVSHSEPRWPGRIFVSSPSDGSSVGVLRLLENIVHESMHLQLTRNELEQPMVKTDAPRIFSPWKCEERETQGVLHGIYVFSCISSLFSQPTLLHGLSNDGLQYAVRRRAEIALEFASVDMHNLTAGLTERGTLFLDAIRN